MVRRNLVKARNLEGLGALGRLSLESLFLFMYPNWFFSGSFTAWRVRRSFSLSSLVSSSITLGMAKSTQTHPINNWVKWVLTQLNPININVYWILIGYPIRPNYDPSIFSTNHPTLKYLKTTKITKIPLNLKNDQNNT